MVQDMATGISSICPDLMGNNTTTHMELRTETIDNGYPEGDIAREKQVRQHCGHYALIFSMLAADIDKRWPTDVRDTRTGTPRMINDGRLPHYFTDSGSIQPVTLSKAKGLSS